MKEKNIVFTGNVNNLNNKNLVDIYWVVTNKCNFKCPYCHFHNIKEKFSDLDLCKKIIDFIFDLDKDIFLVLSGGEATIHPHFKEIIEYISYKQNIKNSIKHIFLYSNFSSVIGTYEYYYKMLSNVDTCTIMPSFHREFINYKEFYDKYMYLKNKNYDLDYSVFMCHTDECKILLEKMVKDYPEAEYMVKPTDQEYDFTKDMTEYNSLPKDHGKNITIYEEGDKLKLVHEKPVNNDTDRCFNGYICKSYSQVLYIDSHGEISRCGSYLHKKEFNVEDPDILSKINKNKFMICQVPKCYCDVSTPKSSMKNRKLLDMNSNEIIQYVKDYNE